MADNSELIKMLMEKVASLRAILKQVTDNDGLHWDTPETARHSIRVLCDSMGLTWNEKEIITACIYQESGFMNRYKDGSPVKNENKNKAGKVTSTDWGIVQVNDYYNIGSGKYWSSVDQVMNNPEKAVRWMITNYKQGKLSLWSSYKTGAYKKWLHKV